MAQNPQIVPNLELQPGQEKPIDTVVNTIMKTQAKERIGMKQGKTYDVLYNDIKEVLSGLDLSIGDCKKYNEAKIHRKYEIRIADLEEEVKILKNKLKQEQNARSPSKKYIQDLVDQLVLYKFENQKLKIEIQDLKKPKQSSEDLKNQDFPSTMPVIQQYKSQHLKSSTTNSLLETNASEPRFNLKNQVMEFLAKQEEIRKINEDSRSKFESFLKKKVKFLSQWTFCELLTEINKWFIDFCNANEQKVSSRLRSNVLSTFEDEIINQKLPKISTPFILHSFPEIIGGSKSDITKIVKKRPAQKSRQNYSTIEVVSGARQKYRLK